MWYEYPLYPFWSIAEVMDLYDETFVVNLYNNIDRRYLDVLFHYPVLISITESLQSSLIVEYIKSLYESNHGVDALLLLDSNSSLFINYEVDGGEDAEKFHRIYNELKEIVRLARRTISDEQAAFDNLNNIIRFTEQNKHEYFLYIKAYWLGLYFYELSQCVANKTMLSQLKNKLSAIFPSVGL